MKSAGKLLTGRRTRSVENVHHLRLMALLRDLVRDMGTMQAAETLGVDRKTVWRGMSAGRLSPRLADAMELLLLEEGVADSARQLERIEELEGRVEEVAGDVNALREDVRKEIEAVRGEIDALEDRGTHGASKPEGRLVGLDVLSRRAMGAAAHVGQAGTRRRAAMIENRREYPSLVTREPADDDQGGLRRCVAAGGRVADVRAAARGRHQARSSQDEGADHGLGDRDDRRPRPDAAARKLTNATVGARDPPRLAAEGA